VVQIGHAVGEACARGALRAANQVVVDDFSAAPSAALVSLGDEVDSVVMAAAVDAAAVRRNLRECVRREGGGEVLQWSFHSPYFYPARC
jgi:hypothetical protein